MQVVGVRNELLLEGRWDECHAFQGRSLHILWPQACTHMDFHDPAQVFVQVLLAQPLGAEMAMVDALAPSTTDVVENSAQLDGLYLHVVALLKGEMAPRFC